MRPVSISSEKLRSRVSQLPVQVQARVADARVTGLGKVRMGMPALVATTA